MTTPENPPAALADHEKDRMQLWEQIRPVVLFGVGVIVLFFGVFGGWAAFAPLDSAAVAIGQVRVESQRKTVQHLEGGIVREILVKSGDRVEKGQLLIRLDDTLARANLEVLKGRLAAALAQEARLKAERDGATKLTFPEGLREMAASSKGADILDGQRSIFTARQNTLSGKENILRLRVSQLAEEISGLKGQIESEDRQLDLIKAEIADVSGLVAKGYAPKPRLTALERRKAEVEGARAQHIADISRAEQTIAETRLQITELKTAMLDEVVQKLRDVQSEITDLKEQRRASEDVLNRIDVRAPQAGTVVDLKVHTSGGVIAPGEALLEIVPLNDRLIVEARVDPKDIDVVQVGMPAQVRFTAFSQRRSAPFDGVVATVSADTIQDKRTGVSYYLADIELTDQLTNAQDGAVLQPGMQAEVMIVTGERTLIEYLLGPVGDVLNRGLRED